MTTAERFPKRAQRAARTRAAILAASAELFEQHGYAGTTMRAIAERAGVSVETVYLAGSKASLLSAAMTVAFSGGEEDLPLVETEAYAGLFALPDLDRILDRYVDLVSTGISRSDALWRTARAAADAEPEIRRLLDGALARRRADIAGIGPWLLERGIVAPEELGNAIASVSVLVSHETYEHLHDEFGWSLEMYRAWLRGSLARLLFTDEGNRP